MKRKATDELGSIPKFRKGEIGSRGATSSLSDVIEGDVYALIKESKSNEAKKNALSLRKDASKRVAVQHVEQALQANDYIVKSARSSLQAAHRQVTWKIIEASSEIWTEASDIMDDLAGAYTELLKSSGGGGWEAKVFEKTKKLFDGKPDWHLAFSLWITCNRTTTHYGYRYSGKQGPHTIARILGIRSRRHRMVTFLRENKGVDFKAFGCKDKKSISLAHELFQPYLALPKEIAALASIKPFVFKLFDALTYVNEQKSFSTANYGLAAFKDKFPSLESSPEVRAIVAFWFYKACFDEVEKQGHLVMMLAFGQILADLHPLATVTLDRPARHDETKGGGEGGSMANLESAVAEGRKKDDVRKAIEGNGSNKGLVDEGSVKGWSTQRQTLFAGYKKGVIDQILKNYGFG